MITFFIYLRAGRTIYEKRRQLHEFSIPEPEHDPYSMKTTEVYVTSEVMDSPRYGIGLSPMARRGSESTNPRTPPNAAYSVTISSSRQQPSGDAVVPVPTPPGHTPSVLSSSSPLFSLRGFRLARTVSTRSSTKIARQSRSST